MGNRVSFLIAGLCAVIGVMAPLTAFAADATVNTVAETMVTSSESLPGLVSGLAYILGLVFGVLGVLKMKEHVENPNQTPLRTPVIRFIAGGALFALPIILQASYNTVGTLALFGPAGTSSTPSATILSLLGSSMTGPGIGFNNVLQTILDSISSLPGLISAMAYFLGLIAIFAGILKVKEHVEDPDRAPLREGVIRLLAGGALFALPTIYSAAQNLIAGTTSITTALNSLVPLGLGFSAYAPSTLNECNGGPGAGSLGEVICGVVEMTSAAPSFFVALAYLFGLVMGLWAIFKIRDHVLNPQQVQIWEGISRLVMAGLFFALPYAVEVMVTTVSGDFGTGVNATLTGGYNQEGYVDGACGGTGNPLDVVMACAMRNVMAPLQVLFNFFTFVAGIIFIMVGISRLMKSAQDGARGPGGLGTIFTFFVGGILISYNEILKAVNATFFQSNSGFVQTAATLSYTTGMTADEIQHAGAVIETIIQFMIIVGIISFIRGWFILRDVAEGNQQASLMAGTTHILGGALAVNLGPLLNAVQATLGVTGVGIQFG